MQEIAQLKDYLGELAPDLEETSPFEGVKVLIAKLIAGARDMARPAQLTPAPAYAGLRGEEEGPYLYQAGEAQVAIEFRYDVEQQDRKVLLGLVMGVHTRELKAHLWRDDEPLTEVSVDELGNFVIPGLEPAKYELILSGPETEIHIQTLQVGSD
jgi:hypothetical protein